VCGQGRLLGIKDVFTPQVAQVAVSLSAACDPQVAKNANRIYEVGTHVRWMHKHYN
jgi:alanyl-tRNA synthetase